MKLKRTEALILSCLVVFLGGRILVFSQMGMAHLGDEGTSLLAALLINEGRKPYFDFHCQHPPLYFYLTAGWMRLFGDSWRSVHVMSTVLTAGAVALVAAFVFRRLQGDPWRLTGAVAAAGLFGMNPTTMHMGSIGQYYGLLFLLMAAAFWLTTAAPSRGAAFAILPGAAAGAGVCTSLLAAPAAPVFMVWVITRSSGPMRWKRAGWFVAGAALPLLAPAWMALRGGLEYVFHNVILYHFLYRGLGRWEGMDLNQWNLQQAADWVVSPWTLAAALPACAGLWFTFWRQDANGPVAQLCGWAAAVLTLCIALARPTFSHYFVLSLAFLSILAGFAVVWIGQSLRIRPRIEWNAAAVVLLALLWVGKFVHQRGWQGWQSDGWLELEEVAAHINQVTAPGAPIYAYHDAIYFAARRPPPPGLENSFARDRTAPAQVAGFLHMTPQREFNWRLKQGIYDTAVVSTDGAEIREAELASVYKRQQRFKDYIVFWEPHGRRAHPGDP